MREIKREHRRGKDVLAHILETYAPAVVLTDETVAYLRQLEAPPPSAAANGKKPTAGPTDLALHRFHGTVAQLADIGQPDGSRATVLQRRLPHELGAFDAKRPPRTVEASAPPLAAYRWRQ